MMVVQWALQSVVCSVQMTAALLGALLVVRLELIWAVWLALMMVDYLVALTEQVLVAWSVDQMAEKLVAGLPVHIQN